MSRCEHAGGCDQPAAAKVASPQIPGEPATGWGFAIVRPITSLAAPPHAVELCVEHTHLEIDVMLMRSQPERSA